MGEPDSSGRRRPVPLEGWQFAIALDTLLAAVGEQPDVAFLWPRGESDSPRGGTTVSEDTLATTRPGVFAGGGW